jgi:glycosyltransferase involved in cell wall biosynthesis
VALILRVYSIEGASQVEIRDSMRAFIRKDLGLDPDRTPEILFVDETLSHGEMRSLYAGAQAFVLPSRGEGFGRPYLEALLHGLPTVGTGWGGQLDFLSDETGYLIEIEGLEEVPEQVSQYRGCRWARPSVEHLRTLLRRVYEDPEEGRRKARRALPHLLSTYNVRRIANLLVRELNRVKE